MHACMLLCVDNSQVNLVPLTGEEQLLHDHGIGGFSSHLSQQGTACQTQGGGVIKSHETTYSATESLYRALPSQHTNPEVSPMLT